ncbi:T9SS type A sorting domain-containing protein [Paenimyroides baculatum]|uniref:T9SS type A sorting domain-containing protein n=1 Tax=Paenimyroides baculatum TaxID=2608000 RepID=A0A5M6CLJ7_9FLAO|nr:T9SS type A sorting domain-containing protein [Paenimyroides baculatum]KAA5535300.1 T9SS type A sorting domain-containing protein [Paenimyroides baculatum]
MKKIILYFTIIASNYYCNAQSINDNWILGNNLVKFNNGSLSVSLPPNGITPAGSRTIVSDENGDLLFYLGNDDKFYDKNGGIISPNYNYYGSLELKNTYSALQNAIITPNPGIPGEYFVTTMGSQVLLGDIPEFHIYSVWVLDFNDPAFPLGNIKASSTSLGGLQNNIGFSGLATLKKANSNEFFQVVSTSNGIIETFKFNGYIQGYPQFNIVSNTSISNMPQSIFSHSMLKISPDGSTLGVLYGNDSNIWNLYIADFDNITGKVTNINLIKTSSTRIKDFEFSSNSALLYILMGKQSNNLIGGNIVVRNLANIAYPETTLYDPSAIEKDNLQRATDGNIYFTNLSVSGNTYSSDKIYKIDNSNDLLGMNINSNYTSLLNNIVYTRDQSYLLHKKLGTIPELVPDYNCVEDIYSSNISIINSEVNKSAINGIVLNHTMNSSSKGYYQAGNSIVLSKGFSIKSGSNVVFKIDDCTSPLPKPFNKTSNNESTSKDELIIKMTDDIKVYPNPFSEFVNLDLSNYNKDTNFTLVVYDIHGKKVKDYRFNGGNTEQLRLNELSSGIYVLKVSSNQGLEKSFKLIKK